MTSDIKRILLEKAKIYRKYVKNGRKQEDLDNLRNIMTISREIIKNTKHKYFSSLGEQLSDPSIGSKKYWSIKGKETKI